MDKRKSASYQRGHLKVSQLLHIWIQVIVDPIPSSRESEASDEQYEEHQVGERSCEVRNLNTGGHFEISSWIIVTVLKYLKNIPADLPRGSDAFPDTEVAAHPAEEETQSQLPPDAAQLLDPSRHAQHPPPDHKGSWFKILNTSVM